MLQEPRCARRHDPAAEEAAEEAADPAAEEAADPAAAAADRIATRIEGAPEEESRRHDVREGWISFWAGPMCERGPSDE